MLCLPHTQPLSLFSTEHSHPFSRVDIYTPVPRSLSFSLCVSLSPVSSLLFYGAPHTPCVSLSLWMLASSGNVCRRSPPAFSFDGPFSRHRSRIRGNNEFAPSIIRNHDPSIYRGAYLGLGLILPSLLTLAVLFFSGFFGTFRERFFFKGKLLHS